MHLIGQFLYDPNYWLFVVGVPAVLALWAEVKVKAAYARAAKIPAGSGLTGAQTAQRILNFHGISNVAIEPARSFLGDHYDPRHKVLRLSPDVYHGRSLASLGIAAHEVGHAIQDATAYGPLAFRNGLVPMASIGSNLSIAVIFVGIILNLTGLAIVGLALFGVVVLFQLVNLPVEFNASKRAREVLLANGMVNAKEDLVVGKVLSAAAMTYVAATITAVITLLYYASKVASRRS